MESYVCPLLCHHSLGHQSDYIFPNSKKIVNGLFEHMTAVFQFLFMNVQYSGVQESTNIAGTSPLRTASVRNETGVLLPPTELQPSAH